jgi:hypothetical protein
LEERSPEAYNIAWWNLAMSYSTLELSYPEDGLPALAGIIRFHAAKLNDIPLLGLWNKSLARDLAWRCEEEQASTLPGIPTWTLLSCPGEIEEPITIIPDNNELLVDTWDIDWEGDEYVSRLKKSTLKVKSKIFETIVEGNAGPIHDNFQVSKSEIRSTTAFFSSSMTAASLVAYFVLKRVTYVFLYIVV